MDERAPRYENHVRYDGFKGGVVSAETPRPLTPGKQLSIARQAQGKSLAQISDATRILESRLEAIERDDYSAVGISPAFVIGYVKAFAAQVDVQSAPLIEVLNVYFKHRKATEEHDNPVNESPKTINWVLWLASGLALLVFLGLGQWYIAQESVEQPVMAGNFELQNVDLADLTQDGNMTVQRDVVKPAISPQVAELSDRPRVIKDTVIDGLAIADSTIEVIKSTPSSLSQQNADQNESDESKDDVLSELVGSEVEKKSDRLELVFTDECWLEVFDANGQRLLARLAKTQEVINLDGQAPFDIKLGNAHSVKITVNDREVELTPSPNRRVLRIQVGP